MYVNIPDTLGAPIPCFHRIFPLAANAALSPRFKAQVIPGGVVLTVRVSVMSSHACHRQHKENL